jgi:type I restriction enzyme M protein
VSTVLDALAEDKAMVDPLDHKVARALLPEYLVALTLLEEEVAELVATIKLATTSNDDDAEEVMEPLSEAEIKELKRKLSAARKKLKGEKTDFALRLTAANEGLDGSAARVLVIEAFRIDLLSEAAIRLQRHRNSVVSSFEVWWDKYRMTLRRIEQRRDEAAFKVAGLTKELSYE